MLIANPIYDVVFKRLMENERVAKFFIGTLLHQRVVSLEVRPKEFTYSDTLAGLAVFRLDFVAIIKAEDGSTKKILIEIQKAQNHIDLMRFRNYLAEQYKKEDRVGKIQQALPLTTIYILGFNLKSINTACIHVERQYRDLINDAILEERNDFIERLTHDSYLVQVKRITKLYRSRLDKLLSVFEQNHFIDDKKIVKEYLYDVDDDDVKEMTNILPHSGTDPQTRAAIEVEREAWRSVNAMFAEKERVFQKQLEDKNKALADKDKALEDKDKALEDKNKALEDKDKALEDKNKALEDKNKALEDKEQKLERQKKLIEELQKKLKGK